MLLKGYLLIDNITTGQCGLRKLCGAVLKKCSFEQILAILNELIFTRSSGLVGSDQDLSSEESTPWTEPTKTRGPKNGSLDILT